MRQVRVVARLFGILAVSLAARAHAVDFATARLHIDGPEQMQCAAAAWLELAVENRLERRLFVADPEADLRITVTYSRPRGQWVADIELNAKAGQSLGQRRLSSQARECSAMNESLALVLALMVDLTRAEVVARSVPMPTQDTTEVHVPMGSGPMAARNATDETISLDEPNASNWSNFLGLYAQAQVGLVPDWGWGANLAFELRHRSRWASQFGVGALLPSTARDSSPGRASFSAYLAAASLCRGVVASSGLDASMCAGIELGVLHAAGVGYERVHDVRTALLNPFAELESTWWPTTQWGLRLGVGLASPLIRDDFYAKRADGTPVSLFKPAILSPFLQVGFCLHL